VRCLTIRVDSDTDLEFTREEQAFASFWSVAKSWRHAFVDKTSKARRAASVLAFLESMGEAKPGWYDSVAVFCHGLRQSSQLGFETSSIDPFAQSLKKCLKADGCASLYSGSNAKGVEVGEQAGHESRCFAARLHHLTGRDVYAHTTAGHTTRNPYVVRLSGDRAEFLIKPGSPLWSTWRRELWVLEQKTNRDSLRFLFPFLSQEQLEMWLSDRDKFEVEYGRYLV
jgi:hypothetical protein